MLPTKLKIGGHQFVVIEKDLGDSKDLGQTDFSKGVISIETDMPETVKWSTLIHEVMHVMNPTLDSSDLGHSVMESLSEQLYQVLKDNELICTHTAI